jgi:amino acid transporter
MKTAQPPKSFNYFDGVCLTIGLILGVGIYEAPPLIAASAGSEGGVYFFWILGALLSMAGVLCYVELASAYPREGGDYYFLKRAYGPAAGFAYGWSQIWLIRPGAIAAVSFPVASYLKVTLPDLTGGIPEVGIACGAVLLLSGFNALGTRSGKWVQNTLTSLSYIVLLILVAGAYAGSTGVLTVESGSEHSSRSDPGLALILVLFCYGGWSELALVAGEVKRPRKTFLYALCIGLVLVAGIYFLINSAYIRVLGFEGLIRSTAPAVEALSQHGKLVVGFVVVLCCLSSLNALILAGGRITYALGRDYPCLSFMSGWNTKVNSPVRAILIQALVSVSIVLLAGSFRSVLVYTTAVVWFFYFLVGVSLMRLRQKDPGTVRPYRVWLYPWVPVLFCSSCLYLIYAAVLYDWKGSLITMGIAVLGFVFGWYLKRKET